MFDHAGLTALSAIIVHGSFDAAAQALGLTQSAVSQRIRALEERVGSPALVRGTPCTPTAIGLRLYRHAEEVARLEATLTTDLGAASTAPLSVRIATNADSLATWLLPALAGIDEILFDLVVDDQDHSADLLRRGEVAAAITGRGAPVQGCDAHPLGALRYIATASPEFAQRWFPDGPTSQALTAAPALVFNEKDRLQASWAANAAGQPVSLPRHRLPSTTAFVEAAELGLGWGMNPEPLVRQALKDGRLVALSDVPLDTPLFWQVSRVGAGALLPLTRSVKAAAKGALVT
ncbi:MAG: LysR family transcriptional regulator ArgP [Pseudomonadota bacterium]